MHKKDARYEHLFLNRFVAIMRKTLLYLNNAVNTGNLFN